MNFRAALIPGVALTIMGLAATNVCAGPQSAPERTEVAALQNRNVIRLARVTTPDNVHAPVTALHRSENRAEISALAIWLGASLLGVALIRQRGLRLPVPAARRRSTA